MLYLSHDEGHGYKITIHHHIVAETSSHNKEVKDFVASKVFVSGIKKWKFQGIDNASNGIKNATG